MVANKGLAFLLKTDKMEEKIQLPEKEEFHRSTNKDIMSSI